MHYAPRCLIDSFLVTFRIVTRILDDFWNSFIIIWIRGLNCGIKGGKKRFRKNFKILPLVYGEK